MYVHMFNIFPHTFFCKYLTQEFCVTVFNDRNWGETFHQLVCLDFHFWDSRLVFRSDSRGFTSTRPPVCQWSEVYILYWLVFVGGREAHRGTSVHDFL